MTQCVRDGRGWGGELRPGTDLITNPLHNDRLKRAATVMNNVSTVLNDEYFFRLPISRLYLAIPKLPGRLSPFVSYLPYKNGKLMSISASLP